ncbi:type VII secretion integral membrane protein EccD [Mycobacterium rhizamassiliense]|nr:type VII secretion integral membrane protein EccD [Mycobacterium rhizamassiliense]
MSESDLGLRRVSIHAGGTLVDVALPSQMPVATLIPPIVDIVGDHTADGPRALTASRYQLSRPGRAALPAAKTLAQNGIRDGDTLLLSRARARVPGPRYDDGAEAISASLTPQSRDRPQRLRATRLAGALAAGLFASMGGLGLVRNSFDPNVTHDVTATAGVAGVLGTIALIFAAVAHRACHDPMFGNTLAVIATLFAAVAGFLAVPGPPGLPNVLLAAMMSAVAATLVMRVSGGGVTACTAISCFGVILALAAMAGMITAAPLRTMSSITTLVSLGLLGVAARLSIVMAGLSPKLPTAPDLDSFEPHTDNLPGKVFRAEVWLNSLVAAFSVSAAAGAIITALGGAPRPTCIAFAMLTGVLLLLRGHPLQSGKLICVIGGVTTVATALGRTALSAPAQGPWIALATASLVAAACILGFVTPTMSASPIARRSIELFECLALVAMVPLTCWVCGLYGAARAASPPWG